MLRPETANYQVKVQELIDQFPQYLGLSRRQNVRFLSERKIKRWDVCYAGLRGKADVCFGIPDVR